MLPACPPFHPLPAPAPALRPGSRPCSLSLQVISALYLAGNRAGSFGNPPRLPYTYSRVCVANKERAGKGNCSKVGGGDCGGWAVGGWCCWLAGGSWLLAAVCHPDVRQVALPACCTARHLNCPPTVLPVLPADQARRVPHPRQRLPPRQLRSVQPHERQGVVRQGPRRRPPPLLPLRQRRPLSAAALRSERGTAAAVCQPAKRPAAATVVH